jgi:hypothetical protein
VSPIDKAVREGMKSSAEQKADSLAAFARSQGAILSTFAVTITQQEAFELLDRLAAGAIGFFGNHELLVQDIEEAKRAGDPWRVLGHFQLNGFDILRAELVLN